MLDSFFETEALPEHPNCVCVKNEAVISRFFVVLLVNSYYEEMMTESVQFWLSKLKIPRDVSHMIASLAFSDSFIPYSDSGKNMMIFATKMIKLLKEINFKPPKNLRNDRLSVGYWKDKLDQADEEMNIEDVAGAVRHLRKVPPKTEAYIRKNQEEMKEKLKSPALTTKVYCHDWMLRDTGLFDM